MRRGSRRGLESGLSFTEEGDGSAVEGVYPEGMRSLQ